MAGLALAGPAPSARGQAVDAFEWPRSAPEEQGIDSAGIVRLLLQVRREAIDIDSMIVVRHGRLVAEVYLHPDTATTRHVLYSASKSFTSALVGIALEEGLFASVDERVVDIFAGATSTAPSANLSRMTLRHLLTMSTGHASDTTYRIMYTADWVKSFLDLPVENAPGAPFVYNSGATFMLSAAIQRRAGMNAAAYGRTRLFEPLGITEWTWDVAPGNITTGGWGLSLCARDMAKFGQLYLDGGVWQGRRLIPAAWVAESGRKQVETGPSGTFWESGYGYQFWMNDFGGYRADGARGQFIFVLPQHDAVVVFTANLPANWIPGDLTRSHLLPAFRPEASLPANPKANALLARVADVLSRAAGAQDAAPLFTALPEDVVAAVGASASFSVVATGTPAPVVHWCRDGVPIPGGTGSTLTLGNLRVEDAGEYTAVATNSAGRLVSWPATLTLRAAPQIRRAPASRVVCLGESVAWRVDAAGDALRYSWSHDGNAITGQQGPELRLEAVRAEQAGTYQVTVSNSAGTVTSAPVSLRVVAGDTRSRLVNLSVRGAAGVDERTLIVGLVVAGDDPSVGLPVLLRGIGPSLAAYEVDKVLADPAVILHAGGSAVAANGDWRGDPLIGETGRRLGAFNVPRASDDAALFAVLTPRTYTVHAISSLPSDDGVVLAECYDASESGAVGGPRLCNLSARGWTGPGEQTLIAGLVVAGSAPMHVLVRGVGPALTAHGVTGVLANPRLQVFSGNTVVGENDDWGGTATLRETMARVGAFGLDDASPDAALLLALEPGVYTAHVTGVAAISGVALIEVYALPE